MEKKSLKSWVLMAQHPLPACCCCCCWATAAGFGAATAFWPEGNSVSSTSLAVRNLIKTEIFGDKPSYHLAAFLKGPFWEDFRIQKHSNQHNLETLGGQHFWSTTPSSCPKLASCSFSCCCCLSRSSRSLLKSSWLQVKVLRIFQGFARILNILNGIIHSFKMIQTWNL